jgi:TrmH family RNA methyltransferase
MKRITSRENPWFKALKKRIGSASAMRQEKLALLDGIHLCQAFLQTGSQPSSCLVSTSALVHPEVAALLAAVLDNRHVVLDDILFNAVSQLEHAVGIAFLIDVPVTLEQSEVTALTQTCVLLDRIQDPGNLGSILRSAAAAGVRQIYCASGSVYAWSPKVLRAGMGAHFHLEIFEDSDLQTLIAAAAIPVLATSSHAGQTLYQRSLKSEIAWLFGNEGGGVAPELQDRVHMIRIPQPGGMESLNVAAAAAVCLFEQVRQRLPVT